MREEEKHRTKKCCPMTMMMVMEVMLWLKKFKAQATKNQELGWWFLIASERKKEKKLKAIFFSFLVQQDLNRNVIRPKTEKCLAEYSQRGLRKNVNEKQSNKNAQDCLKWKGKNRLRNWRRFAGESQVLGVVFFFGDRWFGIQEVKKRKLFLLFFLCSLGVCGGYKNPIKGKKNF